MSPDLKDAEQKTGMIAKFNPSVAEIARVKQEYADLIADPEAAKTPAGMERVKGAIKVFTKMRTDLERHRTTLKADALAFGRAVDAEAKRLAGLILEGETPLQEKKRAVEEEQVRRAREAVEAAERKDREERERKEAEARKFEEELKAERERKYQEDQARLAEERRLLAEERRKHEAAMAAQKAAQDAEAAELRAERERVAAEQRKLQAAADAEARRIKAAEEEANRRKWQEEERARLAKEAEEQAEQERVRREHAENARRLREEVERAEAAAKAEAERKAAEEAKPDVQKVVDFGNKLLAFLADNTPVVKVMKVKAFMNGVIADLDNIKAKCQSYKGR